MIENRPPNTNVLAGLACPNPECGSVGPFCIQAEAYFEVSDDGASEFTELDFREDSFMKCVRCSDEGSVAYFRVLTPLTEDIVVVSDDGAVSWRTWQTAPQRKIRNTEIDLMLSDVATAVPSEQLPLLPPTHVAFVRRPDQDVDRQVLRPLNHRINRAFNGTTARGPVVLIRRSLLAHPEGA